MVLTWHATLEKAIRMAIEEGHLREDTDAHQMLFEIHGLILALHHDARFLRIPGALDRARHAFERVVSYYAVDAAASPDTLVRAARR
jgi:Tetracyclin repressor-like, C-terminal domain